MDPRGVESVKWLVFLNGILERNETLLNDLIYLEVVVVRITGMGGSSSFFSSWLM